MIDFTRSLPPVPAALAPALAEAWAQMQKTDLAGTVRACSASGLAQHRQTAAVWLACRFGCYIDPERLILTNGTQSAVVLLLRHLVKPGQILAAECLSYGMLRSLTDLAGVTVKGLPIDTDGLVPEPLAELCTREKVGAIYCNPTFHNPTALVMSESRRQEIAAIARRFGIPLIEDDPIGLLYPGIAPPIAALAPDVTWFVSGLTKTIAQGMRVAHVVAPGIKARETFLQPISRLSNWVPAPLMIALADWLLGQGMGRDVADGIAAENLVREGLAKSLLPKDALRSEAGSPHIWLPMSQARALAFESDAQRQGVLVRSQELFRVDDGPVPTGIRVSLSSPTERTAMVEGLGILKAMLEACAVG